MTRDEWLPSEPVVLLPAGSTEADVPADTPVGTRILFKV